MARHNPNQFRSNSCDPNPVKSRSNRQALNRPCMSTPAFPNIYPFPAPVRYRYDFSTADSMKDLSQLSSSDLLVHNACYEIGTTTHQLLSTSVRHGSGQPMDHGPGRATGRPGLNFGVSTSFGRARAYKPKITWGRF